MIKIGKYYVHEEDISYLTYEVISNGNYHINFILKSMKEHTFQEILSKIEFNSLEGKLKGEKNEK